MTKSHLFTHILILAAFMTISCEKDNQSSFTDIDIDNGTVRNDYFTIDQLFRGYIYGNMSNKITFDDNGELYLKLNEMGAKRNILLDTPSSFEISENSSTQVTIQIGNPLNDEDIKVPFSFDIPWHLLGKKQDKINSHIDSLTMGSHMFITIKPSEESPFKNIYLNSFKLRYPSSIRFRSVDDWYSLTDNNHSILDTHESNIYSNMYIPFKKTIILNGEKNISTSFQIDSIIRASGVLHIKRRDLKEGKSWPSEISLDFNCTLSGESSVAYGSFDVEKDTYRDPLLYLTAHDLHGYPYFMDNEGAKVKLYDTRCQIRFTNNTPYPVSLSGKINAFREGKILHSYPFGEYYGQKKIIAKSAGTYGEVDGYGYPDNERIISISEHGYYPDLVVDSDKDLRYSTTKINGLSEIFDGCPTEIQLADVHFVLDNNKKIRLNGDAEYYLSTNFYMGMPLRLADGFMTTKYFTIDLYKFNFPGDLTKAKKIDIEATFENTSSLHFEIEENSANSYIMGGSNKYKYYKNNKLTVKDGYESPNTGLLSIHMESDQSLLNEITSGMAEYVTICIPIKIYVDSQNEGKPLSKEGYFKLTNLKMKAK